MVMMGTASLVVSVAEVEGSALEVLHAGLLLGVLPAEAGRLLEAEEEALKEGLLAEVGAFALTAAKAKSLSATPAVGTDGAGGQGAGVGGLANVKKIVPAGS